MRNSFFLVLVIFGPMLFGQSLTSSAGSVNAQFSYSLGEVFILTSSDSSRIVTAGFHQPNLWGVAVVENPQIKARVFPNPTNSLVTIDFEEVKQGRTLVLTSSLGQVLTSISVNEQQINIPFDGYAAGTYNLTVLEFDRIIANYRIIKVK